MIVRSQVGRSQLVKNARARRAILLQLARKDINVFCGLVLKDEKTGEPVRQSSAHKAWHELADKHDRLLIWAHIESGKTVQLSIGRTLWELGRDPSLRHLILSNTKTQATKVADAIRRYIESSSDLRDVFPNLLPGEPWGSNAFSVKRPIISKDPSIQTSGVHGNVLGSRLDRVVLDDILDYENTQTEDLRRGLIEWIASTVFGRVVDGGRWRSVGTAFHPQDALHHFARQGWAAFKYPVVDAEGHPRWPERWSLERIAAKVQELGPIEAQRQLMCEARDDSTARFKRDWIEIAMRLGEGTNLASALHVLPQGYRTYTGVDLAVQQKDANDWTVLFTIAIDPHGNRNVLNIEAGKWSGPEIVVRINQAHQRYQSIVIVENNACFVPGTRVLTSTGYKPIESVVPGDLVWTHKARWRTVVDTLVGTSRTVTTARVKGALPVVTTPNHWFYMREAGRVPGRGGGHHRPISDPDWVSYGVRNMPAYTAMAIPRWPAIEPTLRLLPTRREPAQLVHVDEELALVLGLYMAEGHSATGQVCWTLNRDEAYLGALIERAVRKLTTNTITHLVQKNTLRVVVSSTRLANALKFGTYAEKCLPLMWMGWPLHLRLALVRGWLLGDGAVRVNNGRTPWPSWSLSGDSISRDWIMFVRATLAQAGVPSMLRQRPARTGMIEGRIVQCKESFHLGLTRDGSEALRAYMTSDAEAIRWARWWDQPLSIKHTSGSCYLIEDDHAWAKVPAIEDAPYAAYGGAVHNLVVEEDESYTVEDFIVHNAQDFIRQFAVAGSAVPIIPFTTGRNKAHPEFGIESLATEMAQGKWRIPNHNGKMHPEVALWVDEMLFYSPAAHTGDRLMASWFAREGARLGTRAIENHIQVDFNRR